MKMSILLLNQMKLLVLQNYVNRLSQSKRPMNPETLDVTFTKAFESTDQGIIEDAQFSISSEEAHGEHMFSRGI